MPRDVAAQLVGAQRVALGRRAVEGIEQRQHAGAEPLEIGQRGVEPVGGDRRRVADVALAAEVPLAEVAGRVAGALQRARQRRRRGIEPLGDPARLVQPPVAQVGADAPALRVLAGEDRRARRRADRRVDVERFEAPALRGQAIDVPRLGLPVAEAREVAPAHVVDEHEDDVGRRGDGSRGARHHQEHQGGGCEQQAWHGGEAAGCGAILTQASRNRRPNSADTWERTESYRQTHRPREPQHLWECLHLLSRRSTRSSCGHADFRVG